MEKLNALVMLVRAESERQNLVAASTIASLWSRHIVDSLQLTQFAPDKSGWLDIGTGAGFPGLAIAIVNPERHVTLVEPRRLRAEFLQSCIDELRLPHVAVLATRIESVEQPADVISARAVARMSALFDSAQRCANSSTTWLLPKGRNVEAELAEARQKWHGMFHVEHSVTSPESHIIIATGVRRRR